MAVRAKEFQVLQAIVEPVTVPMVDVEDKRFAQPFTLDWATGALAVIHPSRFEQGTPQDVSLLTPAARSQHENLFPGCLLRALVRQTPVRRPPQEVGGVDLQLLQLPGEMGVRPPSL
jgi:hypothetical protein